MGGLLSALPTGVQGELRTSRVRTAGARFNNSEFEGTRETIHEVRSLRVMRDGKMGVATSTKPQPDGGGRELVEAALEIGRASCRERV